MIQPSDNDVTDSCTLEHENEDEKVESIYQSNAIINEEDNENFPSSCKKFKKFARKAKAILCLEDYLPINLESDNKFPKNIKEDQAFPEFMNFSKRQSGSYISYKEDVWDFKLDDENKFPEQKFFLETYFDYEKRIFTGWVDWTLEPILEGGTFRQYKLEFSEDFQKITGGFQIIRNKSGEIIDRYNYGPDLLYEQYEVKKEEEQKQQLDEKDVINVLKDRFIAKFDKKVNDEYAQFIEGECEDEDDVEPIQVAGISQFYVITYSRNILYYNPENKSLRIHSVHQATNKILDENEQNEEIFDLNGEKFEITAKCPNGHLLQFFIQERNGI